MVVEAVAQFNYSPQEPDELPLEKGDVISDIIVKSDGWWEGTLLKNNKRGMFPDNYVKVLEVDAALKDTSPQKRNIRTCKVRYSYAPANSDELEIKVDDIIQILDEVEEGWWKGQLNNKVGVFPSNFVEEIINTESTPIEKSSALRGEKSSYTTTEINSEAVITPVAVNSTVEPDAPILPPKPVKELYQALFPYEAQNEDELTLKEGDIITLITKNVQDKGWWKGELNGKVGVFPDNFVELLSITEPNSPSSLKSPKQAKDPSSKLAVSPNQIANTRKSLDSIVSKTESQSSPPIVSKKPQLPPPPPPTLKKPQISPSSSNTSSVSPSGSLSKNSSTTSFKLSLPRKNASPPVSPTKRDLQGDSPATETSKNVSPESKQKEQLDSSVDEVNSEIDGCFPSKSASGSYTVNNARSSVTSIVSSTTNLISDHGNSIPVNDDNPGDTDLDVVSRGGSLYHPTLFRAKAPRKRPPSTIILKDDQLTEGNEDGIILLEGLTNGSGESHVEKFEKLEKTEKVSQQKKLPWVEELKLNQAKKSLSQGRTRVIIGPCESSAESNPEDNGMTTTIISSVSGANPGMKDLTTTITSGKSGFVTTGVGVTFRPNSSVSSQRPMSMYTDNRELQQSFISSPSDNISVPLKQWNELNDKVAKLELVLMNQQEVFSKQLADLTSKLNEEIGFGKKMRQEIDKLTDLVTQV